MKKILVLLPLISAVAPIATNLHSHNVTHKSPADLGQSVNNWQQKAKNTNVHQLLNHFSILKTKYNWDANKVKIRSFNILHNNGYLWGAMVDLSNSLNINVRAIIKYDKNTSYNVNNWNIQKLPKESNNQILWQRNFNAWVNSKGKDTEAVGALALETTRYWAKFNKIDKDYKSVTSIVTAHLVSRYNVFNWAYTTINHINVTPHQITGRFLVTFWSDLTDNYYYIDFHANFKNAGEFNYKNLIPNQTDWVHHDRKF